MMSVGGLRVNLVHCHRNSVIHASRMVPAAARRANHFALSEIMSSPIGKKYSSSIFPKYVIILRHPASAGGAYRDRHGRWERDAVDVRRLSAHS
jgi:hypothetical protein